MSPVFIDTVYIYDLPLTPFRVILIPPPENLQVVPILVKGFIDKKVFFHDRIIPQITSNFQTGVP